MRGINQGENMKKITFGIGALILSQLIQVLCVTIIECLLDCKDLGVEQDDRSLKLNDMHKNI